MKKFISLTQTGENTAIYCLTQNDWKLDLASDNYFQNPDAYYKEPRNVDKRKLDAMYSKYKDPNEPDKILADGILRYEKELFSVSRKTILKISTKLKTVRQLFCHICYTRISSDTN